MTKIIFFSGFILLITSCGKKTLRDYPIKPVPFTEVKFEDTFWTPRLETNRTVTVPYDFKKCEETGRIDNFAKAGGLMEGEFVGIRYNDSDVFKIIEGASYSLSLFPDPELEKYLDDLIFKIAAAQEDDGYLYTARTINPDKPAPHAGDKRWSYLNHSHELYNVGHMYEAAVAFYQATGKRSLLDVAIKNAKLISSVFGPEKKHDIPGHQEIEIGLAKLYRVTGEEKYLQLAKFFLDERGRPQHRKLYGEYVQDHKPVTEQAEAVGHAVRAGYMYSGMADIAALTGDKKFLAAIDKIWENVAYKKLYITGGIGARAEGEAFGENYELPNLTAYNETCAAIANMMWNYRLFLLHGEAKYLDVFERTLYNGFLSGVGLSGNEFFYPNPLESTGDHKRSPWFDCSCCPSNVVRFLPSLPGYVYAVKDKEIFVNLFIQGKGKMSLDGNSVSITQDTNYPWDGLVKISLEPKRKSRFAINVRIPGWAQEKPVPSDLYSYFYKIGEQVNLKVNGKEQEIMLDKGFAKLACVWEKGDVIELNVPMPIRKVVAHKKVKDDVGKFCLERGPIIYCAEGIDNGGKVLDLILPKDGELSPVHRNDLLNGVTVLTGQAFVQAGNQANEKKPQVFTAVPYYAWAHRGQGEMKVWFLFE